MEKVITAAQMLGQAILSSEIYRETRLADQALRQDPEAGALLAEYQVKVKAMQSVQGVPGADEDMKRLVDRMEANASIQRVRKAEAAFDTLMENVNQVLQLMLSSRNGGGCSGSCEGCGGCG